MDGVPRCPLALVEGPLALPLNPTSDDIQFIATSQLEQLLSGNLSHPDAREQLDRYVNRLVKYMRCPPECFVVALQLLQRLDRAETRWAVLTVEDARQLFLTATVLAIKLHSDSVEVMPYYAYVGGLPPHVLIDLEVELFKALRFALYTTWGTASPTNVPDTEDSALAAATPDCGEPLGAGHSHDPSAEGLSDCETEPQSLGTF